MGKKYQFALKQKKKKKTKKMNRDHSVIFENAAKYCILDSFVDCEGYFISSKGFLPTVVDKMVM